MAIDVSPRFTVSLRGYDKDEVEQYLESVSQRTTQSEEQLYDLQEQARYLEEEHERLLNRVEELEGAIRSETPHSVNALGERLTLILNEAEEGASDTLSQASAQAEFLLAEARKGAEEARRDATIDRAQAADVLIAAQRQAEMLAERVESDAKARAAAILGDAELRAQRRTEQMEKWAAEVVASTEAEQARLADEFAMIRRRHDAEVRSLLGERDDAMAALRSLQTSLARAIERVPAGRTPRTGLARTSPAPAPEPRRRPDVITDGPSAAAATATPGTSTTGTSTTGATAAPTGPEGDVCPPRTGPVGADDPTGSNGRSLIVAADGVVTVTPTTGFGRDGVGGEGPTAGVAATAHDGSDDATGGHDAVTTAGPVGDGATAAGPDVVPGIASWSCSLYDLEADAATPHDVTDGAIAADAAAGAGNGGTATATAALGDDPA